MTDDRSFGHGLPNLCSISSLIGFFWICLFVFFFFFLTMSFLTRFKMISLARLESVVPRTYRLSYLINPPPSMCVHSLLSQRERDWHQSDRRSGLSFPNCCPSRWRYKISIINKLILWSASLQMIQTKSTLPRDAAGQQQQLLRNGPWGRQVGKSKKKKKRKQIKLGLTKKNRM